MGFYRVDISKNPYYTEDQPFSLKMQEVMFEYNLDKHKDLVVREVDILKIRDLKKSHEYLLG